MKRIALAIALILSMSILFLGCQPIAEGGKVLDSGFKLIEVQKPPVTGTPDEYTPEQNLAFTAYVFNNALSWESSYQGTVTAIGTNQKVKNVRKFDGEALFAQAISASGVKSVAEQKFFKDGKILSRPSRKIDKANMTATWSNKIVELSQEDFFKAYGVYPSEIAKFAINKDTIIKSEKVASDPGTYAYRFELNAQSADYIKNEVRTLAGSKSDPVYKSVEFTIVIDEHWTIIRTEGKEKYSVAIMGGITCESVYTEDFTLNGNVNIAERAFFETSIPGDGEEEKNYDSLDYLALAFGGLASNDEINLKADIGTVKALINFDVNTGSIALKVGDTVIKNGGEYLYILGKQKAKIKLLSLYQAIIDIAGQMPEFDIASFSLPLDTPEINALIDEVKSMLGVKTEGEEGDEDANDQPKKSMINRIVDGISEPMDVTDNSATVAINFTLDGINFDVRIAVKNETLDYLAATLAYNGAGINIGLTPTSEKIVADESGASDISKLVEAIGMATKKESFSFRCDDMLFTVNTDGNVIFNSPSVKLGYDGKTVKLNYLKANDKTTNVRFDVGKLELEMPQLKIADILSAISEIGNSLTLASEVGENELTFNVNVSGEQIAVKLSANESLLTVNALGKTLTLTDEVATLNKDAKYVKIDSLINLIKRIINDGSFSLNLKPSAFGLSPNIDLTVDFGAKKAIAKVGSNSFVQISDAIYILNDNMRSSLSFDALDSLLPKYELPKITIEYIKELLASPRTDLIDSIKSIIDNFTFETQSGDLAVSYYGKHNGVTVNAKAIITNTIKVNATVIVDSNRIRLDISEGEKIGFVNTSNCSRLDPIVYTAKEMANNMPVFDLNFKAGKNDITAHVMPDLNGGGLTALVGDIGLYAYDKLYISNKLGTYSMEFETVKSIASQFGLDIGDDGLNIGDIINKLSDNMNYSVFDEDNMLIALIRYNDMDINLYFDYATSFFDHATIDNGNFTVDLTISSLDSLYKPEQFTASPIDSISGIINPVKNLISGNTITVNLKNLIAKTSGLNIDGFVSFTNKKVSETETKLDLALEINLKKTETHTIKARLENGNNIRAYYIYGGKTMQLGLTKDNLLSMAFKVTDILGIKLDMLEKYRPTISDPVSSPIIYNALPADFRDSLIKIVDLLEKGLSLQNISLSDLIEYAELLSINAQTGKLSLSVQNDSPIEIEVGYSNLRIKSVKLDSASISGNIELDRTFTDIGGDTVGSININGLNEMLTHVLNTVNLGEYNVKGKIDLKLDILNISIPAMVINFDLTAKIVDNKTPYVYLHLSVPKVNVLKTLLHQAESFLFFYDGMMYLKSERYDDSLFGGNNYKETLFKKCNPKEFANNLVDYLFFLVPLDESIQTPIKEQIAAGTSENASYAEALSSFNASVDKYEIAIDLNKLTGKSSLDILNLTFLVTENEQKHHREISSFDINTKMLKVLNNYLINLSIAAKLHAYDGIIEYGVNRDTTSGNILNMPNEIKEMKKTVPEWN